MIGAEPPSPIKGGSMLGGIAGRRPQELGEVTAYVLEKSPCRVLVTAPPDTARSGHDLDALVHRQQSLNVVVAENEGLVAVAHEMLLGGPARPEPA